MKTNHLYFVIKHSFSPADKLTVFYPLPGQKDRAEGYRSALATVEPGQHRDHGNAVKNFIHEFGHLFNNLLWIDNPINGKRDRLPEILMVEIGGFDRTEGGYPGDYGTWQQSTIDTPSENFADMFIGWVFGKWESTLAGPLRRNFMENWMPGFISASYKLHP